MANLTIKNIPDELYQILKQQAAKHRRSLNSEIIINLEKSVQRNQPNAEFVLQEACRIREKTSRYRLTDKKLKAAKERGRS